MTTRKPFKRPSAFVVRYGHKHGTDLWLCSSDDKAWKSIGGIISTWVEDEIQDAALRKKIRRALKANRIFAASELWFTATEEWFSVESHVIS